MIIDNDIYNLNALFKFHNFEILTYSKKNMLNV